MQIGFIGLGNMGGPMAANLIKAGHRVTGFDTAQPALDRFTEAGGSAAAGLAQVAAGAELLITMLPAGPQVREVYATLLGVAPAGTLLVDSSTIDVETSRAVAAEAEARGFDMLDAPVSGGVGGAVAASLTFMVGGSVPAFARALPVLQTMGRTIVHAGPPGTGQAAKICNNLILGISMIAVCEAFALADRLGLDRQILFDISAKSSGQCWSLTNYCPVPGPVPGAPSNRDYEPGFTADMMLKDLNLAQLAAGEAAMRTPLGAEAAALYAGLAGRGWGGKDFSIMFRFIESLTPR